MPTILVVEDEAVVAIDIAHHLKRHGYEVSEICATGQDALRAVEEHHPDLILMDILLRGDKDGIETAREIVQNFDIPVVFLTGQADESTLQRVESSSAYGFISKPIDATSLFPTIELALTRHAYETRLKESESRFRAVTDSAADAIFSIDMEGNIAYWNKAAERVFGWTSADMLGQSTAVILPQSAVKGFFKMLPKIGTGDTYKRPLFMKWRRKDGTEFLSEPSFSSWQTTEGTFATAIVHDISEQREIIESVQAGIALVDPTSHEIIDINTTAARLFGAPKEDIIGAICHRFICPTELGRCPITDLEQTLDNEERVMLTADGESRPILKSVRRIKLGGHEYLLESFVDISDRKQIEGTLRESEAYYRTIFENSAAGMAILDDDMTLVMINSKLEEFIQSRRIKVEGLKKWTEFVAPEDTERLKAYHRARRSEPSLAPKDYEFTLLAEDGTRKNAYVAATLIPGTKRSIVSIIDITPLKKAQEALRQQAEILDAAHDAIMTLDPQGMITYWNRGAERLFGWTAEEAKGQNANELLRTKFPESQDVLWPQLVESGQWEGELVHATRNDVPLTVSSSWTLLKDAKGEASAILEISSDITKRKMAEARLAESEAKLRITFATMADGIIVTGLDERVTDCNDAILHLTQQSRAEIIDKPFDALLPSEFRSLIPNARKLLVGAVFDKISPINQKRRTVRTDSQLLTKSGQRVDIETNISLIEDAAGRPNAFLVVARDITERKQMEAQLDNLLADLKRSNADLEQFAYIASHDLQEPLRMITSYIQLIEEDYKGKLDADADEYIAFTVDGAKRMQTLINDLLAYSRVGTRGEPFMPTDMNSVLSKAIANLELAIEESHAVVTHDQLPTVLGDESQLIQLLQNLLGNAIKFRSDAAPTIHVGAEETNDGWLFSVHDNGIGIDMKYAERIFTVFQRLHARDEYPGTGIGLAVVKKIVERHGGRIWVESEPNKGSIFYFTIPQKEDTAV